MRENFRKKFYLFNLCITDDKNTIKSTLIIKNVALNIWLKNNSQDTGHKFKGKSSERYVRT